MSDRSKLYLVSILGIGLRSEPTETDNQVDAQYCHLPILIIATSRKIAEEEACVQAKMVFSNELGFQTRHVAVQPVPQSDYQRIVNLSGLGLLAISGEPAEDPVEFECSEEPLDPDDNVILEFNKPAN